MAILFVFAVCLCASTIGGICGIGGGVVIKPLLDATGIMSVSTVSFLSGLTVLAMAMISVYKNRKTNELDTRRSIPLGIGAAVGGVAGKQLFELVKRAAGNDRLVKLTFESESTGDAVISEISKRFDAKVNIVLANVEMIGDRPLGGIIVILKGNEDAIINTFKYLEEIKVGAEVLSNERTA